MVEFHATTICAVRRGPDDVCIGGDGQVTMGETAIMKNGAKKVKKIYKNTVLSGFAGSVADAFALTEKFEEKLEDPRELQKLYAYLARKGFRYEDIRRVVQNYDVNA